METNVDLQNWQVVTGFLLPLLMSVILQKPWSREVKAAVTFVVCYIVAAVQMWLDTGIDASHLFGNGLAIFVIAISTFYGFWKPTGIAPKLEAITSK